MFFTAEMLKELMEEKPFRPFRVFLTNGRQYDVPNHDAAFITENKLEIGLDLNKKGFAQRTVNCAYGHIANIEEIESKAKKN